MNNFNQKIKKYIVITIILIIIVVLYIIINNYLKKEEENRFIESHPTIIEKKSMNDEVTLDDYFIAKDCVNNYYKTAYAIGKSDINNKEYNVNMLLNIFNDDYIKEYNLDTEQLAKQYETFEFDSFLISNIYSQQQENNLELYLIYGTQINTIKHYGEKSGLILLINNSNNSYSIIPYDYMKKLGYGDVNSVNNYKEMSFKEKSISSNNIIESEVMEDKDIVKSIFIDFKLACKYDSDYAYNLLDEDYSKKRFDNRKNWELYIKDIDNIFGYKLEKMSIDDSDAYFTRYVCLDNKGNYFIIKKDDQIMKYSIMLDVYTVPVKEVTEKYEKSNIAQKTKINIEKFKQMINLKDYYSAYNVLDKTFRENNFGSVENFEKYIKQKWPEYIKIIYNEFNEVEDLETMKVHINSGDDTEMDSNISIEKTFIIKLIDDNEFVMSFNVE